MLIFIIYHSYVHLKEKYKQNKFIKIVIKLSHIHTRSLNHFLFGVTDAHDFPQNTIICTIKSTSDAAFLKSTTLSLAFFPSGWHPFGSFNAHAQTMRAKSHCLQVDSDFEIYSNLRDVKI